MSRETILDELVYKLQHDIYDVQKATMRLLRRTDRIKVLPYIGVIPGDEVIAVSDGYNTRYKMDITLFVHTAEDKVPLEGLISDIKAFERSLDLGAEVDYCKIVGIQEVTLKDEEKTRYSAVGILLELIYVENYGTSYPAIESRTLTEPTGIAHYKVYETIASGSADFVSGSIIANVYDSHSIANLSIPAGSGSITIGALSEAMDEEDGALYDNELVENQKVEISVRVHSAYIGEYGSVPQPFVDRSIIDNVTRRLWGKTSCILGGYYRVYEINNVLFDQTFENTLGASMNIIVEKIVEYI